MQLNWKNFLTAQGAAFSNDEVLHFSNPEAERQVLGHDTVLVDLSHEAIISINGDDAEVFLHNQFTNDVKKLNGENWQLSGYCSPKGRLLTTFYLWKQNNNYYLQLPAALRESIQKRLTMYVLRSKVKLTDISNEIIRFGIAGPGAASLIETATASAAPDRNVVWQSDKFTILGLDKNRFEILAPLEEAQMLWQTFSKSAVQAGIEAWNWLRIQAGEPNITPATQEEFVPQMVNFEVIEGVNFKKGCYPGQEIVARMQYLGKLKRRMYLAHVASQAVAPGDLLFSADLEGQATGMIVNAAPSPEGYFDVLAVIQIESAASHPIHLQSANGSVLELRALPYAVP